MKSLADEENFNDVYEPPEGVPHITNDLKPLRKLSKNFGERNLLLAHHKCHSKRNSFGKYHACLSTTLESKDKMM